MGTPKELSDEQGKILWNVKYLTYGNVALKEVAEVENNLRFQGQYFDEETGLHYNRHRYYNPNTGQFISQDPIGLLGGVNNYQYAPNPVGWVDPFGLTCKETGFIPDDYDLMEDMAVTDTVAANNHSNFIPETDAIYANSKTLQSLVHQHEFLALRAYTGGNYEQMNAFLRGRNVSEPGDWQAVNNSAVRAMKKMSKIQVLQYTGVVFRGTTMSEESVHSRFPGVGATYKDKGFTSTSTSEDVAFKGLFAGNVRITAETKTGMNVDLFSAAGGEKEVLFKPDTEFVITKKELMADGKTWDIHLKEK